MTQDLRPVAAGAIRLAVSVAVALLLILVLLPAVIAAQASGVT